MSHLNHDMVVMDDWLIIDLILGSTCIPSSRAWEEESRDACQSFISIWIHIYLFTNEIWEKNMQKYGRHPLPLPTKKWSQGADQSNLSEGESRPCKLDEGVPQVSQLSHCLIITFLFSFFVITTTIMTIKSQFWEGQPEGFCVGLNQAPLAFSARSAVFPDENGNGGNNINSDGARHSDIMIHWQSSKNMRMFMTTTTTCPLDIPR